MCKLKYCNQIINNCSKKKKYEPTLGTSSYGLMDCTTWGLKTLGNDVNIDGIELLNNNLCI